MKHGFIKVAAATPIVHLAEVMRNAEEIRDQIAIAEGKGVEVLLFPELSLTGYSCQDLFYQQSLLENAEQGLLFLIELSRHFSLTLIVGLPITHRNQLFNCAAVVQGGKLHGLVPKTYLPNHGEFYEMRWFSSATLLPEGDNLKFCGQQVPIGAHLIFTIDDVKFAIELCEDLWAPIPPSSRLTLEGAEIIFNLSASNELVGKQDYIRRLISIQSAATHSAYVYSSAGFGESTQDLVFGGRAFIFEDGQLLAENKRFQKEQELLISEIDVERLRAERQRNSSFSKSFEQECKAHTPYLNIPITPNPTEATHFKLTRKFSPLPFIPNTAQRDENLLEVLNIQCQALASRLRHLNCETVVIGISGGLDSTLALLVAAYAFDSLKLNRTGIVGITMPGFGTSDRTYRNALRLMTQLGITIREISIAKAVMQHFADISHEPTLHDTTYENAQARERTQILMDVANQLGGIVVGTGDLSESALGWATYNGDHMSMYNVNASVPKTLIRHLVKWVAENSSDENVQQTLLDIVDTPISPELTPTTSNGEIAQRTEDLVGPYELHDFFLYYTLRYGFRPSKIFFLAKKAFDGTHESLQYDEATIIHWLTTFFRRFFAQQFKRSCMPDGPKVGSCALSPRGDWRMPTDAKATLWLEECNRIAEQLNTPTPEAQEQP